MARLARKRGPHKSLAGGENVTGNEIREMFLRFFEERGHRRVRSSSLVPHGDPTLLFTNAGMNQFKDVFLGQEKRDYTRATSSQKCVRAGGKHNDLENVGRTARHHTFFEMLGNFSFGDYFKKDAIEYAWTLVTSPDWCGVPLDKLYFTVFGGAELSPSNTLGADEEAADLWAAVGAPRDRIVAVPGLKENFWAMGDVGPCGPCSEIHYDMGPAASEEGHKDCPFPCECGRYVEIWNLVFMQFNRDASGDLTPLPKPCVDTGMGLERIAAALLNQRDPKKFSNYDTDLLRPLIDEAARLTKNNYAALPEIDISLRILADHTRAATFLISDGMIPSNEGRGYVLRLIIRRALYHGQKLRSGDPIFHELTGQVVKIMERGYPELVESADHVVQVITAEEERYTRATKAGLEELNRSHIVLSDGVENREIGFDSWREEYESRVDKAQVWRLLLHTANPTRRLAPPVSEGVHAWLAGDDLFRLHDTFGLRPDFVGDVLQSYGLAIDWAGYQNSMREQRERAKASWKGGQKEAAKPVYAQIAADHPTEKDFYFSTASRDSRIQAIVKGGASVAELAPGEEAEVFLDRTVVYAESGGQSADTGALYDNSQSLQVAEVLGAYYPVTGLIAHRVVAKETLRVGDRVAVVADATRREHIKRNHTGTHLVHAALRNILGAHVKQAGSLNAPDHLRFDFSHFAAVDPEELRDIEQQVNEEILRNNGIETDITSLDDALASGALAFFGDKYPEAKVRVVTIPDAEYPRGSYSKELCGGTHVHRAGDIGVFKIVSEQSVAAGVRRIEAITGVRAFAEYQKALQTLRRLAAALNTAEDELPAALERALANTKQLEKQVEALRRKSAQSKLEDLAGEAREVKGIKVLAAKLDDIDRDAMRLLVDSLRQRLGSGVVVLGTVVDGKVALIVGVTKDLTSRIQAGKIVQALAKDVGGSGGGRPDLAEAGGKDTSALESAINRVPDLLQQLL
jgi:alanyl-tRNA synthetase